MHPSLPGLWHPFDVEGEVIQGPYSVTKKARDG